MPKSNKPSLRNFAVLQAVCRSKNGKVYLVRDRRVTTSTQLLFLPSKIRAWPRYLAVLADLDVNPVRLRDGRVALLLDTTEQLENLKAKLKTNTSKQWKFDALTGFHPASKRQFKPLRLATFSIGILCLLLIPQDLLKPKISQSEKVILSQNTTPMCSMTITTGEPVELESAKIALINGIRFRLVKRTQLGGLVQMELIRLCDKSTIRLTAWKAGKNLHIDSVG